MIFGLIAGVLASGAEDGAACSSTEDSEAEAMKMQLLQGKHDLRRKERQSNVAEHGAFMQANLSAELRSLGIFKCGKASWCTPGSICCEETSGGLCGSPGSVCCGTSICSPGSICCGKGLCASPGSTCCEDFGICAPGSTCCPSGLKGRNMCCSAGFRCCPPESGIKGCCPLPKENASFKCGAIQCVAGSVCCGDKICGSPGSICCGKSLCAPGNTCCGGGICASPGGFCCGDKPGSISACGPGSTCCPSGLDGKKMCCGPGFKCCPESSGLNGGCCPDETSMLIANKTIN